MPGSDGRPLHKAAIVVISKLTPTAMAQGNAFDRARAALEMLLLISTDTSTCRPKCKRDRRILACC